MTIFNSLVPQGILNLDKSNYQVAVSDNFSLIPVINFQIEINYFTSQNNHHTMIFGET